MRQMKKMAIHGGSRSHALADPDPGLRGRGKGGGFVLLVLPTFRPSAIFSFFYP